MPYIVLNITKFRGFSSLQLRCREQATLIHRAADKGCSRKVGFRHREFWETRGMTLSKGLGINPALFLHFTFPCKSQDFLGALGRTRTCDLLIRSQTLYPAELRALGVGRVFVATR